MKVIEKHKKGFKKTKIGWIPEDWEVKKLKDFTKVITGSTPPTKEPLYYGEDYFFVGPSDLGVNKYILKTSKKLSKKGFEISRIMPKGSVLFTCIGSTIGKIGISKNNLTSNQQINAVLPNDNHESEFVYYELERLAPKIKTSAAEQAVPMINKTEFESNYIILPPLPEQKKIATILSDWDTAIATTQTLIKTLQLRKKGLMQQLLTGKTRLAGFRGEWREVELGEITSRITKKNEELNDNVITISAQRGFVKQEEFFKKRVASKILTGYYLIEKGDFAYNKSYSNGYPMGAFKRLDTFDKAVVTTLYICFSINDKIDSNFLLDYFEGGLMVNNLMKIAQEGGRAHGLLNIGLNDFFSLKMIIPSKKEQIAISNILKSSDQEIKHYQNYKSQLQTQKKGLMQQLLTGKIRVKV